MVLESVGPMEAIALPVMKVVVAEVQAATGCWYVPGVVAVEAADLREGMVETGAAPAPAAPCGWLRTISHWVTRLWLQLAAPRETAERGQAAAQAGTRDTGATRFRTGASGMMAARDRTALPV